MPSPLKLHWPLKMLVCWMKPNTAPFQEQTLNRLTSEFSRAFSVDDILKSALRQLSLLPAVNDISVHLVSPTPPRMVAVSPNRWYFYEQMERRIIDEIIFPFHLAPDHTAANRSR